MKSPFTKKLLWWNRKANNRLMPWKGEKDPFKVWLSEIILQQTRVEQGLAYYSLFISAFPSVHHLASASEQAVFKLWEGLGYYNRCKNLIATAKVISTVFGGRFPDTYEGIRSLKGVGSYTAAAIASFAYNLPYAVVDGNVIRVLSRYFGITTTNDTIEGKALYALLSDALLDKKQPGIFNQAIMDFGAVICKPKQPLCNSCIQQKDCQAYQHNWVNDLPVRSKAVKKKIRWFYYFLIEYNDLFYVRKRNGKDIWENLYELVLKENEGPLAFDQAETLQHELVSVAGKGKKEIGPVSKIYRQQLSHQTIVGQFIRVKMHHPPRLLKEYKTVSATDLVNHPFPKFISSYLSDESTV